MTYSWFGLKVFAGAQHVSLMIVDLLIVMAFESYMFCDV